MAGNDLSASGVRKNEEFYPQGDPEKQGRFCSGLLLPQARIDSRSCYRHIAGDLSNQHHWSEQVDQCEVDLCREGRESLVLQSFPVKPQRLRLFNLSETLQPNESAGTRNYRNGRRNGHSHGRRRKLSCRYSRPGGIICASGAGPVIPHA